MKTILMGYNENFNKLVHFNMIFFIRLPVLLFYYFLQIISLVV